MTIQNLVGIQVDDRDTYADYRRQLAPVLASHGAELVFDIEVGEAHTQPEPFNRLFLMSFPSTDHARRFSEDAGYRRLRDELFVPSVSNTVFFGRIEA